jgi:hypothetical protein
MDLCEGARPSLPAYPHRLGIVHTRWTWRALLRRFLLMVVVEIYHLITITLQKIDNLTNFYKTTCLWKNIINISGIGYLDWIL